MPSFLRHSTRSPERRLSPVRQFRQLSAAALVLALLALTAFGGGPNAQAAPPPATAGTFTQVDTAYLQFFVEDGSEPSAAEFATTYGPLADQSFTEIAALFGATQPPRFRVYVYSTAAFYDVNATSLPYSILNPLGATVDIRQGDLSIFLPSFLNSTPLQQENILRHGLARLLLGTLSAQNLPRGFSEGMAQYVERPETPKHARYASTVSAATQQGEMLSWSDLNRDDPPTTDRALIEAESYATVAFLVDRYGLRAFRDLVTAMAAQPDWRAAMRTVYNRDPGEIEKQWRDNLTAWTGGDWQINLVAAFDLNPARELLAAADYYGARARLEDSLRLFTDLGDQERLAETEALLAQCETGIQAETLMTQTQQALESQAYDRAKTLVAQARSQYATLPPEHRPVALLDAYERQADLGLTATQQLDDAQHLSRRWGDYPEAREAAVAAGQAFATLGNEDMANQARKIVSTIDERQQRLVLLLISLAVLTATWLALWLWARGPTRLRWSLK